VRSTATGVLAGRHTVACAGGNAAMCAPDLGAAAAAAGYGNLVQVVAAAAAAAAGHGDLVQVVAAAAAAAAAAPAPSLPLVR